MTPEEFGKYLEQLRQKFKSDHLTPEEREAAMIQYLKDESQRIESFGRATSPILLPPTADMNPICIVADGRTVSYGFRRFTDEETLRRARQRWPHAKTIQIRKA